MSKSVLSMEKQELLLWVTLILNLFLSMTLTSLRCITGKGEAPEDRWEIIFSHKRPVQIFNSLI